MGKLESGSGAFVFPKKGKTRIRLVVPKGLTETEFFLPVVNSYGKNRYLVLAVVPDRDDEEDNKKAKVRPVILPKTALTEIVQNCIEGYDFFSEEEARGVTIIRSGEGRTGTSYSVVASPQAVPLKYKDLDWGEKSMEEWAAEFEAEAEKRRTGQTNEDLITSDDDEGDDEPAPAKGTW